MYAKEVKMGKYTKSILHALATIAAAVVAAGAGDGHISGPEWVNVAIIGVGTLAVFTAPNVPFAAYTKSILAAFTAGLTVLASAILGGITTVEWYQIAAAALGAVGVYAFKNE
jgi:hypothetical protein